MTDQDPSGFIPCPAGNGTDAFVHLEVLLFMGMLLGAPTPLLMNLVFERRRSRLGWLEPCAGLDSISSTPLYAFCQGTSVLSSSRTGSALILLIAQLILICHHLLCSCLYCFQQSCLLLCPVSSAHTVPVLQTY